MFTTLNVREFLIEDHKSMEMNMRRQMTLMNQNLMKLLKVHNIDNVIFFIVIMCVTLKYVLYS